MLASEHRRLTVVATLCVLAVACTTDPTPPAQSGNVQAANPAARKCVQDGYQLEPVRDAAGVVTDHRCIDPASGRRCEVWEYFRGTCRLRTTPTP
jgi:putative hemolysin